VSIVYNATLIALKVAAAIVTGSVAILSEALNSSVDLVASVIAFVAVRRADEPPDVEHPYGHEKVENVAASIEGVLIIGGAAFIIVESIGRLVNGNTEVESLGLGIAVIAFSTLSALAVSVFLRRRRASMTRRRFKGMPRISARTRSRRRGCSSPLRSCS
jgi:cation diffusion facilitator family transporter